MEQYEAAADIIFSIDGVEIPVASIDTTKDVTIEQIRENNLKPIGFAITEIEFTGSISFSGNGYIDEVDATFTDDASVSEGDVDHLEDLFTDSEGIPHGDANITILHENSNNQTSYESVMIGSDGYETETSDFSGISFDIIAGDRTREKIE